MSIHLTRDLDRLHRDLMIMCAKVEDMIHAAVASLESPSTERAMALVERDNEIDECDVQLEELCLKVLALHQPVAIDLRRITTVMKISGELERVADLGVNICERACGVAVHPGLAVPESLHRMAQQALEMLHKSIDAYVALDCTLARKVCADDEEVDQLNREIIEGLIARMHEQPDLIEPAMHLFSASRQIERVADHATNIAEDVVYLVEGDIVRHRRLNRHTMIDRAQ